MDATEDIFPLGSDPARPDPGSPPDPDDSACAVCHGLPYRADPAAIKGWWRLAANKKFEAMYGIDILRPEVGGRMVPHPQTGQPQLYLAGDWVPPGHAPASDWLRSANSGACAACDVVVKALHYACLEFWADVSAAAVDATPHKRVWAQAIPGVCVVVTVTDMRQRFLMDRYQLFEIAAVGQPVVNMPTLGFIDPVSPANHSDSAVSRATEWLQNCRENHPACTHTSPFMPTRLLDISPGPVNTIRLVEGSKYKPYVALSYCWGPEPDGCLRTLAGNIAAHRRAIPLDALPASLAEAVMFSRSLGYDLLWIDALCIIQDSAEDWVAESSTMGRIYSYADLVIGNEVADDCRKPLFTNHFFASQAITVHFMHQFREGGRTSQQQQSLQPEKTIAGHHSPEPPGSSSDPVRKRGGVGAAISALRTRWKAFQHRLTVDQFFQQPPGPCQMVVRRSPFPQHDILSTFTGPLGSRAWTFQESMLPRRLLTFTQFELVWRCYGLQVCECSSHIRDRIDIHIEGEFINDLLQLVNAARDGSETRAMPVRDADRSWKKVVNTYSQRDITRSADRLVAIAGFAEAFEKILAAQGITTRYLAGLWEHTIIESLIWFSTVPTFRTMDTSIMQMQLAASNGQPGVPQAAQGAGKDKLKAIMILLDDEPFKSGKVELTVRADKNKRAQNPTTWAEKKYFPSWSWASTRLPVDFANINSAKSGGSSTFFPRTELLGADVAVWDGDPQRRIVTGTLSVRGRLTPVRLRSMPPQGAPPPVHAQRAFTDPTRQGLFEFWVAYFASLHQARFENGLASGFTPDSPCLFGTMVADVYGGFGADMYGLIRSREQHGLGGGGGSGQAASSSVPGQSRYYLPDRQTVSMFPCNLDHRDPKLPMKVCASPHCWCHFGWTEPVADAFWALEIGRSRMEQPRGNALICNIFLVLRRVLGDDDSPNSYWRIGCGWFLSFGDEPSYDDPFRGSEICAISIK